MLTAIKEFEKATCLAWQPSDKSAILALGSTLVSGGGGAEGGEATVLTLAYLDTSDQTSTEFHRTITVPISRATSKLKNLDWAEFRGSSNRADGIIAACDASSPILHIFDPNKIVKAAYDNSSDLNHGVTLPVDTGIVGSLYLGDKSAKYSCTYVACNPQTALVATAASDGIVRISDFNALSPFTLNEESNAGPLSCLDWNQSVPHVIAASGSNMTLQIWNVKQKKRVMALPDPARRKRASCVRWMSGTGTQLVVAYDDDQNPSLQFWDLRANNYPFNEISNFHSRGVTDISGYPADDAAFTSVGRDGRCVTWTVLRDRQPMLSHESSAAETLTQIRHCPSRPGLAAVVSSSKKAAVYNLVPGWKYAPNVPLPKWMFRKGAASMGFGGKYITTQQRSSIDASKSSVSIHSVQSATKIVNGATFFDQCLRQRDFRIYMAQEHQRAVQAGDEHSALTWELIQTHFLDIEQQPAAIMRALGFDPTKMVEDLEEFLGHSISASLSSVTNEYGGVLTAPERTGSERLMNRNASNSMGPHQPYSNLRSSGSCAEHHHGSLNLFDQQALAVETENFFNTLGVDEAETSPTATDKSVHHSKQQHSTTNTSQGRQESGGAGPGAPTNVSRRETADATVTGNLLNTGNRVVMGAADWSKAPLWFLKQAIMIGEPLVAIEVAMKARRFCDALIIANSLEETQRRTIWDAVVNQYLSYCNDSFLPILSGACTDECEKLAQTCQLSHWADVVAVLCFKMSRGGGADPRKILREPCAILGRRLQNQQGDVRTAAICFTIAGDFRNALQIWSGMMLTIRDKSVRLQNLAEKATVWLMALNFDGNDGLLTTIYTQYIELLASSGLLEYCITFMDLIPNGLDAQLDSLRDRIAKALELNRGPNEYIPRATINDDLRSQAMPFMQPSGMQREPGGMQVHASGMQMPPRGMQMQPGSMQVQPGGMQMQPGSMQVQPGGMVGPGLPQQSSRVAPQHQGVVNSSECGDRHSVTSSAATHHTTQGRIVLPGGGPTNPQSEFNQQSFAKSNSIGPSPMTQPSGYTNMVMRDVNSLPQSHSLDPTRQGGGPPPGNMPPQFKPPAPSLGPSYNRPSGEVTPSPAPAAGSNNILPTAPAIAAAQQVAPGMPNPWPIPTPTQQIRSTTTTTEHLNQRVHNKTTASPAAVTGEPCSAETTNRIMQTLLVLVKRTGDLGENPKRVDELRMRVEEIRSQLESGMISRDLQNLLIEFCKACDGGNGGLALHIHGTMRSHWSKSSKDWYLALKRLACCTNNVG